MSMTHEEKQHPAREVSKALDHPLSDHAFTVLLFNLRQFLRPLTEDDSLTVTFTLRQFAQTTGMVARLEALGIDPQTARLTPEEIAQLTQETRELLPPSVHIQPMPAASLRTRGAR